ncbi:MAG: hypothetical protein ABI537_04770 [Casimicrobiaceae bacterium]
MNIQVDDLSGTAIQELLREHLRSMHLHSPPEIFAGYFEDPYSEY